MLRETQIPTPLPSVSITRVFAGSQGKCSGDTVDVSIVSKCVFVSSEGVVGEGSDVECVNAMCQEFQ